MLTFILAQILDAIVLVLAVIGARCQSKHRTLFFAVIGNLILTIEYSLLGALTGTVIVFLNATRCFTFFMFTEHSKKPSLAVLLIFEVLNIVCGIIAWTSIWSLLIILGTLFYTYGLWQENVLIMKISTAVVASCWIIYNFVVLAYVCVLRYLAELTSAILAIIAIKKARKLQRQEQIETKAENALNCEFSKSEN